MRGTIRLRLTVLYGVVFLITGAVLLTIGYVLVRHNLDARGNFRQVLQRAGVPVPPDAPGLEPRAFLPGSQGLFRAVAAVRAQLRADALHRLLLEYVGALAAMTLVSGVAGWLLAGRALRPLRRIISTAKAVSGENLSERIALEGPSDELKELADTFDGMLTRLEQAFASQQSFAANASHELRTPLAIMRTEIDVALADPDVTDDELRRMGETVRDTVDRCERLLEGLLMLARSQAAAHAEESVDLAGLAADCVTDLHAPAHERQLEVRNALGPAWVRGDAALLERMIANLVDNAIRHNEPRGFVEVATSFDAGRVRLRVANGGPVIDAEDAAALAEPFRRLHRGGDGFGLGLSIVGSVAQVHGGSLHVAARPAGGLEVTVELPGLPAEAVLPITKNSPIALTKS
ncbi:MAG TPA: HAMP domain-containing sensor histidine kinase [Solirubrobacteraceae bacterium]|nr:HAMP domain-containing sensor histidine kinase [Solirubrobacteraceae bacterium]